MQRYWSHAAMLLLGITLTVGFYEGRRLVKNTAKALTAATAISSPSSSTGRRTRERGDRGRAEAGVASFDDEDRVEHKRRRSRPLAGGERTPDPERADKLNQLKLRQRHHLEPGERVGPGALRPNDRFDRQTVGGYLREPPDEDRDDPDPIVDTALDE